jgi:trimethylamine monooxygenase
MEAFGGRIMHAHDYRSAEEFTDQRILVIGTSYSAEDIASQCYKYGVKSVHLSWRSAPMGFHWPDNFTTVPLLEKITPGSKTCHFKDGSTAEIDAIILCTGYKHHFPFVDPSLRLSTGNRLVCDDLHEGVVWPHNPRMMYIGMQDQWLTFNMFDAQAWYARDVIMGRIALPDRVAMQEEWQQWRAEEDALDATDEALIRFQCRYTQRLIEMTDYPKFDMEGVIQTFVAWEHHKHEDIMSFRDKPHKSIMTGHIAPVHHTTWLEDFDDSISNYVNGNKNTTRKPREHKTVPKEPCPRAHQCFRHIFARA